MNVDFSPAQPTSSQPPGDDLIMDPSLGPLFDKRSSGITIGQSLEWAMAELGEFPLEEARVDTRAILSGLLGMSPTHLHLNRDQELSLEGHQKFMELIRRRKKYEPVAYLLGRTNFRGFNILLNRHVLIPRPETEWLVEKALRILRVQVLKEPSILEIGTGSGCIAISIAKELESTRIWASDISAPALDVANQNSKNHNVGDRIQFFQSDLYQACGEKWKGYFDMIISNPPYISSSKLNQLDPDLGYEPRTALDGGALGLSVIEKLIFGARTYLKSTGCLIMEIGYDQGESARTMLGLAGFKWISILKDLNRHDRIAVGSVDGSV